MTHGVSAGRVSPSASTGILSISGSCAQGAPSALDIKIGGLAVGDGFDQLSVTGLGTLDGAITISLISPFGPAIGESFEVLTFGSRSGDSAMYNGLDIGAGKQLDPSFTANRLVLTVAPAP